MDSKNQKKGILSELIKLAKVDNDLGSIEFEFILKLAVQMGVTKPELMKLFEEYIEFSPPKLEEERILHFHRLVLLMNVDENSTKEEINHIKQAGLKMGLNPAATDEILRIMKQYDQNIVPSDRLIEIFTLYHN